MPLQPIRSIVQVSQINCGFPICPLLIKDMKMWVIWQLSIMLHDKTKHKVYYGNQLDFYGAGPKNKMAAGDESSHIKGEASSFCLSLSDGVYVSFRWRYFQSGPSHITHCLLVWSQKHRPPHTHTHICAITHTDALSATASVFTHWDTLSAFIALSQWGTLSAERLSSPRPSAPAAISRRPGLLCVPGLQPACFILLHIKVSSSAHGIRKTQCCRSNDTLGFTEINEQTFKMNYVMHHSLDSLLPESHYSCIMLYLQCSPDKTKQRLNV